MDECGVIYCDSAVKWQLVFFVFFFFFGESSLNSEYRSAWQANVAISNWQLIIWGVEKEESRSKCLQEASWSLIV